MQIPVKILKLTNNGCIMNLPNSEFIERFYEIMKCKYCGSEYTVDGDERPHYYRDGVEKQYLCQACKKKFTVFHERRCAQGEWLMTLTHIADAFNLETCNTIKWESNVVEIYKTPSGSYEINWARSINGVFQISKGECEWSFRGNVKPRFKADYGDLYLEEGAWSVPVNKIELNPELTKLALQNDAMNVIHSKGKVFRIDTVSNDKLVSDVANWLGSHFPTPPRKKQGGCYVATAVYGSYDCPQVWTLRRFRDYSLMNTNLGKLFVKAYYKFSPKLVEKYGTKKWFNKIFKGILDKFVSILNNRGYEDTEYND